MPERAFADWARSSSSSFFFLFCRFYISFLVYHVHRVCMFTVISGVSVILCLHWFIVIHWHSFFLSLFAPSLFLLCEVSFALGMLLYTRSKRDVFDCTNAQIRIWNNRSLFGSKAFIANNHIESIWLYHEHGLLCTLSFSLCMCWSCTVYLKIYFLMENFCS